MSSGPLAGIRVLDLTRLLPGPVCTLHLADLGADVIKIEDTGAGDYARTLGAPEGRMAPVFLAINRNKRGLRLDLKQPQGVAVFLDLARTAHVVVEGFRPGVVDRLGVGYEAVRAVNPALVYCAISGYGQTGPYRHLAGHDINYCSYAGLTDQIGPAGGDPVIPNFQVADILGGALVPAMGILAALVDAQRTGQGRHVDVAMTEGVLAHNVQALAAVAARGAAPATGDDLLSGREGCYNVYRTSDGRHMAVGSLESKFWREVCEVLGRPDLERYHWAHGGDPNVAVRALRDIFATRTQAAWVEAFAGRDCCVSPVRAFEELQDDPQHVARGMFVRAPHPTEGDVLQVAPPLRMTGFDFAVSRPAPAPGEHTVEILRALGYGDAHIDALARQGVI
ncbi:MAG: CaiB/BaiF CoA-transferase family protein [Betaproteobacteria bacterium]|jgi:crotonobetainyl-CoA:carnitine CoA-transferase CaiB-like acyl-CoA transferase